jgi:hypothetical protein
VNTVTAVPKKLYEAPTKLKKTLVDLFVVKDPMEPGLKAYLEKKEKEETQVPSTAWSQQSPLKVSDTRTSQKEDKENAAKVDYARSYR